MRKPLLHVEKLVVGTTFGGLPVVKDVSFFVYPGEVVALIGESGSGKTTVSPCALGHGRPGLAFRAGHVRPDGVNMLRAGREELRRMRGSVAACVAQSAAAAFNPAFWLNAQVTEPACPHRSRPLAEALPAAHDCCGARVVERSFAWTTAYQRLVKAHDFQHLHNL